MAVIVYIGLRMALEQKKIFQKSSPMANRGTIGQSNVKNGRGSKNDPSRESKPGPKIRMRVFKRSRYGIPPPVSPPGHKEKNYYINP